MGQPVEMSRAFRDRSIEWPELRPEERRDYLLLGLRKSLKPISLFFVAATIDIVIRPKPELDTVLVIILLFLAISLLILAVYYLQLAAQIILSKRRYTQRTSLN